MPHFDVDTARRAYLTTARREPITFSIGEDRFTVNPSPSFGDTLDLAEAPEITPETEEQAVFVLARFIERMLDPDDRPRYRAALRAIGADEAAVVIELGVWITEQITGNPTTPSASSQRGHRSTGGRRKRSSGGHPTSN